MPLPIPPKHPLISAYVRAHRTLAPTTLSSRQSSLNRFYDWTADQGLDIASVTSEDIDQYLFDVEEGKLALKPGKRGIRQAGITVNTQRSNLKYFYDWAAAKGHLQKTGKKGKKPGISPFQNGAIKRRPEMDTIPPVLDDVEYAKLQKVCDNSDLGKRDAAILSVLRWGGLRRAEICGLTLASYNGGRTPMEATLTVGTVQHHTKKLRQITIPLHPEAVEMIDDYLLTRGDEPGPLFMSAYSKDGHLTPNGITQMMEKRRKQAGISHRIGIHSFRRLACIALLRAGVHPDDIMEMFGWTDPTMVRRYSKMVRQELAHDAIRATFPTAAKGPMRPRLRRVV